MQIPNYRFKTFYQNWNIIRLGDITEFYNGDRSSKYPNDNDLVDNGVPFINAGDLINGRVNLLTSKYITEKKYKELSGAKIQIGDIIYCLRGTLGKNALVTNISKGTIASSLVVIRPNMELIDINYLFYILNSEIEYRQRVQNDEGAAQPNLSAKNVSNFMIPYTYLPEQKSIGSLFHTLDDSMLSYKENLANYKSLKATMLSKMFPKTGQKEPEIRLDGFEGEWEIFPLNKYISVSKDRNFTLRYNKMMF